jgi:hypothetical protein
MYGIDDAVPFVTSNGAGVGWNAGGDALTVAGGLCVRVNVRGVSVKPPGWAVRDLSGAGWDVVDCVPGGSSLCTTARGEVFPVGTRPRFNAIRAWTGARCDRAWDGRVLDAAHGYDLSSCDVLDGGGDVVVCGRVAAFRRTGLAPGVYWALCLLAVFVVRALSYLIVRRVQGDAPPCLMREALTPACCAAIAGLVAIPDGDRVFVTEEERLLFWSMLAYTLLYLGLYAGQRFPLWRLRWWRGDGHDPSTPPKVDARDPPIYNLISGSLQLIALRLYGGADTPYNPVFLWAIATRALMKLREERAAWEDLTTLCDALVLSVLTALGAGYDLAYAVVVYALALTTAELCSGN